MPKKGPGECCQELHAKFHRASLIRKCFRIGRTKSLSYKQEILLSINFNIFQSSVKTKVSQISKCGFRQHIYYVKSNIKIIQERDFGFFLIKDMQTPPLPPSEVVKVFNNFLGIFQNILRQKKNI